MRTTIPLRMPQKIKWLEAYSWHRWRKQAMPNTLMAKKLQNLGIEIEDANEFVKADSPLFLDIDATPEAKSRFPEKPKLDSTHPDWHSEPYKIFDFETFPFEGVKQAQLFTNSVQIKKGLPDVITKLGNSIKIEHQNLLVERVVKQAFIWDQYTEALPKLRNLEIPQFKFAREFGIPLKRRNEILFRNFMRLCDSRLPKAAVSRAIVSEEEFRVNLQRHNDPVQIKIAPMITSMTKEPLKPITTDLESTQTMGLPDIFPFTSHVGGLDNNIYKEDDRLAVSPESPFPHIHTTYISHDIAGSHTHAHPRWNDDRFSGSTIMYNFATCLLMARRKFGNDVKGVLPEPITTQTVHATGQEFQFSVFQLNNVDVDKSSDNSIKNIVWLTPKIKLFDRCEYEHGGEIFEGYNPEVFKLFMGLYANDTMHLT